MSCGCTVKSSSAHYLKSKDVPTYIGACGSCGKPDCVSDCAQCAAESKCLAVSKRVLAACPPSAARDLLPCYCNCQQVLSPPVVYYNFEIEIINQAAEPLKLNNIIDSIVAGGFASIWSVAEVSAVLYPSDGSVITQVTPTGVTDANGDLIAELGTVSNLEPCDRLVIKLYIEGGEKAYCIKTLAQEVTVLASGVDTTEPYQRTASADVPL